jgi:hypothetical protein
MGGAAASALLSRRRYLCAAPLGLPIGCQTCPGRKSIGMDFAGTMRGLRAAHQPIGHGQTACERVRETDGAGGAQRET